jgi:inorganic triphosphatase YgiF
VTTVVRETERKYELADGVELPGWNGLVGVQPVVGPEEQTLEAVYFDTEDLGLARAGVTLRRRLGGHDAGGTGVPHRSIPRARRFPGKTCGN